MVVAGSALLGRRGFLALAVVAGTAAATVADRALEAGDVDWAALDKVLERPLIRPAQAGYAVAAQPYNAALGRRRPAAIAPVTSPAEVAAGLRLVAGQSLPVAARSGGHSYAGYSTPDGGLVVDVSALDRITVAEDGTAVVGAGARLIDVYSALAAHGRALPAGSCPTVGIAGSTLGGGIGVLARPYGLTCDHLRAATVVTADGEVRKVSPHQDADLFWALTGGGGGNGGIVTDLTFATVPVPTVTVFSLTFPDAATPRVLRAWLGWMDAAPPSLTSLCHVNAGPVPANHVSGTWTGPAAALGPHLSSFLAEVGVGPSRRTTYTGGFLDVMRDFADCGTLSLGACHATSTPGGTLRRESFRSASRMLERPLTVDGADRIVQLLTGPANGLVLLFDSLGGNVAQLRPDDTAFPHRRAAASVQIYNPSAAGAATVHRLQQALTPLIGTGSYVNYLNADETGWAEASYGVNRARLKQIIRSYDPDGVFDFAQSALRA